MGRDKIASASRLSQGLTKRSVSLSVGNCHSDFASESMSSILNMKHKLWGEGLSCVECLLFLMALVEMVPDVPTELGK